MKIVLATTNTAKVREISRILEGTALELLTLGEFPGLKLPPEDADSFEENALKKAAAVAAATGLLALADDSGLVVDALGGDPGVRSARYAGFGAGDKENYQKLLKELENIPIEERSARFVCIVALVDPLQGINECFKGTSEGFITTEPRGENGFGYDPVFELTRGGRTMAELTAEEKDAVSHRAAALKCLNEWLAAQAL